MSPKPSQIYCVLLQANHKPRFAVSYVPQNKFRFTVSSNEPNTNPGLLWPAMSSKQTQVCCALCAPKQTQVCCILRGQNKPRFAVSYEPKTSLGSLCPALSQKQTQLCCALLWAKIKPRFAVSSYEPKTIPDLLCPATRKKQTQVCCVLCPPKQI